MGNAFAGVTRPGQEREYRQAADGRQYEDRALHVAHLSIGR